MTSVFAENVFYLLLYSTGGAQKVAEPGVTLPYSLS